jgi:flagellar biogenesis protein FliO
MDSLFGEGTSLPVRFFIAFVVVFALIGVTAWLIRRFGSGALGGTGARGRAPRLAVIEAGAVDGRRKLVLIRRDNIEHLIMIGGPTDIVVEANIVRGQNARDTASTRQSSATENLTRALPVEETAWPLQPEAAPRPARTTRPAPLEETSHWALPSEPAAPVPPAAPAKRSRSADALAGLAAELSISPSEPAAPAPAPRPAAPTIEVARPKPIPAATTAAAAASSAAADQNLADMASRLEAALRRPAPAPAAAAPAVRPTPKPTAEAPRVAPPITPPMAPVVAPPAPPVAQEPAPAAATAPAVTIEPEKKPDEKPAKSGDMFGSIEEEMANLLGRPAGKPS